MIFYINLFYFFTFNFKKLSVSEPDIGNLFHPRPSLTRSLSRRREREFPKEKKGGKTQIK
jgi:hypothetical protein